MKRARSGFATILFLTMLVPLSLLIFNLWQQAILHHELMLERQRFYQETNYLEGVLAVVVQHLKKQHAIIWENSDRLRQPLILPCSLVLRNKSDESADKQIDFQVVLDKPIDLDAAQLRIRIQMLTSERSVKRSLACLLTRQIDITEKKERYVFVVDHFTFSTAV